jgi:hypothetical protein
MDAFLSACAIAYRMICGLVKPALLVLLIQLNYIIYYGIDLAGQVS